MTELHTEVPVAADDAERGLEVEARELAERLRLALDAGQLGTVRWDAATGRITWDETMERLFGLEPGKPPPTLDSWFGLLHPDDVEAAAVLLRDAVACKGNYFIEHRVIWPDGSVRWLQGKGGVLLDDHGDVTGVIGCTSDVTERKVADLEASAQLARAAELAETARLNGERFEYLGRISEALSLARSREEAVRNVAHAAVAGLGDWCVVYLRDGNSATPFTEVAHTDPEMIRYARRIQDQFPFNVDALVGAPAVMRTGHTEFYPLVAPAAFAFVARDDAEREVMETLAPHSIIVVPIADGDEVAGAIMFARVTGSRSFISEDVAVAQNAAGRLGAVLGNLELIERQRAIATTLQQSLLPARLPVIDGLDVAVRYWAVGEGSEVGGDFYDLFAIPGDQWAVVVGDVCGTGPAAAAVTGVARHTIRAAARHGADHAETLRWLNEAIADLHSDLFCTAVYATLHPSPSGWQLTAANAGHPLPVRVPVGGPAEIIGRPGTLLGVFPDIEVRPVTTELAQGDLVVLYTDGITDVAPPFALTERELTELIGSVATGTDASAADIADRLGEAISAVLPIPDRLDDIALVVLRVVGDGLVRSRWFSSGDEAPREARRFLQELMGPWALDRGATDAAIVVSELVANAVEHDEGVVEVGLQLLDHALRIEVSAATTAAVPRVLSPPRDAVSGRGLQIVEAVSRAWGHAEIDGRRTVWAEVPV